MRFKLIDVIRCAVAVALFAFPTYVSAQEHGPIEVAGGYSFLSDPGLVGGFGIGWFAETEWHTAEWLSLVAEVSRHRRTQDVGLIDVEVAYQTLVAGSRLRLAPGPLVPFVRVLGGITRLNVTARTSTPMNATGQDDASYATVLFGGGIEIPLADRLLFRVGVDYRHMFASENFHGFTHFSTGASYRFGEL